MASPQSTGLNAGLLTFDFITSFFGVYLSQKITRRRLTLILWPFYGFALVIMAITGAVYAHVSLYSYAFLPAGTLEPNVLGSDWEQGFCGRHNLWHVDGGFLSSPTSLPVCLTCFVLGLRVTGNNRDSHLLCDAGRGLHFTSLQARSPADHSSQHRSSTCIFILILCGG